MEDFDVFHLFLWDAVAFEGTLFELNRVSILIIFATVLCLAVFLIGARKAAIVPRGLGSLVETGYTFVRDKIAVDVIGPEGVKYADYLASLFFFIFFCNILELFPAIHFPVTARMGIPLFLAFCTYLIYNFVGFKKQGFGYLKGILFPPGVPWWVYILLTPIEFFSVFLIRPVTLAIRLLANMMAGSVLLALFFIFTEELMFSGSFAVVLSPVTFIVACGLMLFELLVIFIQAYIFTTLSAFYIAESLHGHGEEHEEPHPEHEGEPGMSPEPVALPG